MGARQSRRSVDITTTPKKEGIPADGGDATAPGDGKLERIEETDTKPTTNGITPHTDVTEDKDKDKDDATEKEKDKEKQEEVKAEETKQESTGESPVETAEVTTPTEATPASPNTATSPDSKETKKKEKMKKKWSFRSISFSKKDKNKPAREEAAKNGDVTKEEPLAEGGEEAENGSATAASPVEEKSAASSPTAETESAPVVAAPATEAKEESPASAAVSPAVEKTEEPAPSVQTPVPVEEKKEEPEKVQAEKKVVEVSPAGGQFVPDPVEVSVFRVRTVATPSIVERKTSEDIPSLPPSSPPPTPIDSSPLQRAQQAAATATALAKALDLPAEAADKDSLCPERNDPSTLVAEYRETPPRGPPGPSADEPPRTKPTLVPPSVDVAAGDGNTTVEPSSPAMSDSERVVSSPYDVPFNPESSLSESSAANSARAAEGDLAMPCQARVEEKIRAPSDVVSRSAELVERLAVSESTAGTISPEPMAAEEKDRESNQVVPEKVEHASDPSDSTIDATVSSEEGPIPVSEETLVEAKPAVVIPEDEETAGTIKEAADTDASVSRMEVESDRVVVTEGPMEVEDSFVPNETAAVDPVRPIIDAVVDDVAEKSAMPPPLPESPVPSPREKSDSENVNVANSSTAVPSPVVDAKLEVVDVENTYEADGPPLSPSEQEIEAPRDRRVADIPPCSADDSSSCSPETNEKDACRVNDTPSGVERVHGPTDDLPPAPEETIRRIDSTACPLVPENLSCPLDASEAKSELPLPDENVLEPRNPTETLLTPPRSPSPRSNLSIASALTTSTKDSSQTQLYDDRSNREFKMESVSISLDSYDEFDVELKERLAESLAETEKQEESSVSCQLSNNATSSTTVQETHQVTPEETEAPVENNVAHDGTTESSDETSKVTPPVVPSEVVAALPPSAPAITEDVASVAKAIEEMDISDKAVAAATIECNTNEIIADAHYQNNINE